LQYRPRHSCFSLTGNAIKFTSEGVVTISVARTVDTTNKDQLTFTISDTGLGISEQAQLKLFKSFEQADSSTTRKFGGTGLGLAISRRLIEGMGGQIGVDSKLNQGSSFWFTLAMPAVSDSTVYDTGQSGLHQDLNVLLVEPVDSSRHNIYTLLQEQCEAVEHAQSGSDALQKMASARQASKPYDIVFFATTLNDMSAREFTRKADNQGVLTSTTLVAINTISKNNSSLYTHTTKSIATQLSKPVGRKEVAAAINIAMQTSNADVAGQDNVHGNNGVAGDINDSLATAAHVANADVYQDIHILVAEDNLINQYVTQSMLENMGFSCVVADNGEIALDIFRNENIDLILMDCQMPVLDGFKTTEQIRAEETDSHIPIIALTANAMQGDAEKCFAAGMDSFLTKPIDKPVFEQTILDTLEELINERKEGQSNANKAA